MSETDANNTDSGDFSVYEVGYHLLSSIGEEGVPSAVEALRAAVEKRGGVIIAEEFPKLITLAYTISKTIAGKKEKFSHAYFGWMKFECDKAKIKDLEAELKASEHVLRYLLISTVRESTLAPKRPAAPPKGESPKREEGKEKEPAMSEDEINKAVEELMV